MNPLVDRVDTGIELSGSQSSTTILTTFANLSAVLSLGHLTKSLTAIQSTNCSLQVLITNS